MPVIEEGSGNILSLRSKYRDFVFAFVDFIWEVDENGIYTYAAGKTQEVLGYEPSEFIGKSPFDFMPADEAQRVSKIFIEKLKNKEPLVDLENWCITKSGGLVCLLTNAKPIYDDDGNFSGYHGVDNDITEKKYFENQLLELNKNLEQQIKIEIDKNRAKDKQLLVQSHLVQMGKMISMIAHQWRQPLNAISAATIKLNLQNELNTLSTQEIDNISTFIQNITQQLSTTINNFIHSFKLESVKGVFNIAESINEIKLVVNSLLEQKNIHLKIKIDDSSEINGYKNELIQVLLNLITNSRDALDTTTQEFKEITIHAYQSDETLYIEVCDNGGGIDNEIIDKIFDPYFSTKNGKNGTGLGLYISKTIIEDHYNGKLYTENIKNELGDVFGVCFKIEIKNVFDISQNII